MKVSGAVRFQNHAAWSAYGSPSLLKYLHLICIFVLFNCVEVLNCALGSVVARWDAIQRSRELAFNPLPKFKWHL